MSTPYDFDRQKESDISKIVPKLKGESNFAQWQHRLYMALRGNNKTYVHLIQGTVNKPTPPDLYDESVETVRELAQHRATSAVFASGSSDPIAPVSDVVVRELVKEQKQKNKELLREYQVLVDKWDLFNIHCCNQIFSTLDTIPASYVHNVENPRDAYKLLRAEYGSSPWQGDFKRFEVLINLQHKNNNS
ncbi:Pc20g00520, partial [Penicillium rubens Wisconsin 54-1255]